jgi:hypothetical protein
MLCHLRATLWVMEINVTSMEKEGMSKKYSPQTSNKEKA